MSCARSARHHGFAVVRKDAAIQPTRPSESTTRLQSPAVSNHRTWVPGGTHSMVGEEEDGWDLRLRQGSAACRMVRFSVAIARVAV